jgi:hypothetical protein
LMPGFGLNLRDGSKINREDDAYNETSIECKDNEVPNFCVSNVDNKVNTIWYLEHNHNDSSNFWNLKQEDESYDDTCSDK